MMSNFSEVHIDNKSSLIRIMVWYYTGGKPLSEPVVTQSLNKYAGYIGDDTL